MNTDVEELLREGMERFTKDLCAPAGLTWRAFRRRRRRLALGSVAGVAAAVTAGAVAFAAVTVSGAYDNRAGKSIADTAYVVNRVASALSAAEPGEIAQMAVTIRSSTLLGGKSAVTTAEEWSYGDRWRSVMNSAVGHPLYDESSSASSVYTLVSYLTRTWARQPGLGRPTARVLGLRGCKPVVGAVPLLFQPGLPRIDLSAGSLPGVGFAASPLPAARALRSAISCGALAVAGRQRVDGIETIELKSRPNSPISETIWVRPGTYLPVRVVVRVGLGKSILQQTTADITWLRPTTPNLAKLTVPIPAGFRRVPLVQAVQPILQQIPAKSLPNKVLCLGPDGPTCSGRASGADPGVELPGHP